MLNWIKSAKMMIVTCLFAGSILAILSPYGTHETALPMRLVFWIGLCFVGGIAVSAARVILQRRRANLPPFAVILIYSIASALAVFMMMLALRYFQGGRVGLMGSLQLFFYIWVIAFTISLVGVLSDRRKPAGGRSARPALYDRLKPNLRQAKIYALSAEDHYVRVMTDKGEDLILMRLSDAILEVAPLAGLSPHRSWWVAEQGVANAGRKTLTLHNGQEVPISRNGLKTVRDAGWT